LNGGSSNPANFADILKNSLIFEIYFESHHLFYLSLELIFEPLCACLFCHEHLHRTAFPGTARQGRCGAVQVFRGFSRIFL